MTTPDGDIADGVIDRDAQELGDASLDAADMRDASSDLAEDAPLDASPDEGLDAIADALDGDSDMGLGDASTDTDPADTDPADTDPADAPEDAPEDAPIDAPEDAPEDAPIDVSEDAPLDAPLDTAPDTGPSASCISGATGTHVARFFWAGTPGAGSSRAYVRYDVNTLPDTSRWRAGAFSMSPTYNPVYTDIYLGEGGLEMSGTVFMDIELSTLGLSSLSQVHVAIYGRSFNTTSPGSFSWQTFDGTGASGLVQNSAPYQWYPADATSAFSAGDDGILLRIRPGGPSGSLIVHGVEICFEE